MKYNRLVFLFLLAAHFSMRGQQAPLTDFDSSIAAAQKAQAENNYSAAAAAYRRAAALRPDMPELEANLGLMEHQAGNYQDAILAFRRAIRLKPSLYVPNLFLGIDYLRLGNKTEAVSVLVRAKELNAKDPLASLMLGRAYFALDNYSSAVRELHESIALNPKQSAAWFVLGLAYLKQVERDSVGMTTKYGGSAYAKALFAEALVKQSRYKEAADFYAAALTMQDHPPCLEAEAAFADLAAGNTQKAERAFKTDRAAHPECLLAILGLARLRVDADANLEALQLLEQVWQRDPGFYRVNVLAMIVPAGSNSGLAFADFVSGQRSSLPQGFYRAFSQSGLEADAAANGEIHSGGYSRAEGEKHYMEGTYTSCTEDVSLALKGTDVAALQLLSECSFFAGDYNLAVLAGRALQRASARSGAEALYWLIRANEKLAFAALARFQQLDPGSAPNHILMGDIYRQRAQYSNAMKEYTAALKIIRDDPAALYGLAAAYLANGDLNQAIETSRKALEFREGDPNLELILGEALIGKHIYSEAKPHILKASQGRPQTLPHVHALLGLIDNAEGKEQEAIRELEIGKASDTDGSIHYILARLYQKNGNKAAADKAFAQMMELKATYRKSTDVYFDESQMPAFNNLPQ